MISVEQLIVEFAKQATLHHNFTLQGNYKKGNEVIKKINLVFENIKTLDANEELLLLIDSDKPEVAALAATYSMNYDPEKCLAKMNELQSLKIPHISTAAKNAIENWERNEWYIK